ncbi:hypothetical protein GMDG_03432 [Pseudogymnoascus destructans 20631-21]|uniref:Uncharacterized protein n=1 Tax=Pseudogymnoascus destructans (strain ATCC MYA-4855 / 20631-21) TaxID=658429 RepID=L8G7Y0_PSED2|nr:hypothetical protein GMDG_03432 [Pseudogymnoascus destructans 20631-21]
MMSPRTDAEATTKNLLLCCHAAFNHRAWVKLGVTKIRSHISPRGILAGVLNTTSFEIMFSSLRYIITTRIVGVMDRAEASSHSAIIIVIVRIFIAFSAWRTSAVILASHRNY